MTKEIKKLQQLRKELIDSADKFPADKREEKLFDKWSLKDVFAHLCGWDQLTVAVLNNLENGKVSQWGKTVNEMNQDSTSSRKDKNWPEIYNEFITSSQKLIDSYSSLTDDLWDKPLHKGKKFSAAKFLKIDTNHYQEHIEVINNVLKSPLSKGDLEGLKL